MLGPQGRLLLGEPSQRDLGFAASTGRALNSSEVLSVLRTNGALELGSVGPEHAAQSSDRDPEIMERFAIETIVQPSLCSYGRAQAFEREAACGFLFASPQEVVGQRPMPPGFPLATHRRKLGDLRSGFGVTGFGAQGDCANGDQISWLTGDGCLLWSQSIRPSTARRHGSTRRRLPRTACYTLPPKPS